jgi:hypothetical protein
MLTGGVAVLPLLLPPPLGILAVGALAALKELAGGGERPAAGRRAASEGTFPLRWSPLGSAGREGAAPPTLRLPPPAAAEGAWEKVEAE